LDVWPLNYPNFMVHENFCGNIGRLRWHEAGFRHYIFFLEGGGAGTKIMNPFLSENYLTCFSRPVGEGESIVNFDVAVFWFGGFSNE